MVRPSDGRPSGAARAKALRSTSEASGVQWRIDSPLSALVKGSAASKSLWGLRREFRSAAASEMRRSRGSIIGFNGSPNFTLAERRVQEISWDKPPPTSEFRRIQLFPNKTAKVALARSVCTLHFRLRVGRLIN